MPDSDRATNNASRTDQLADAVATVGSRGSRAASLTFAFLRFAVYFTLVLGLAVTIAAGFALALDLAQFRYATI